MSVVVSGPHPTRHGLRRRLLRTSTRETRRKTVVPGLFPKGRHPFRSSRRDSGEEVGVSKEGDPIRLTRTSRDTDLSHLGQSGVGCLATPGRGKRTGTSRGPEGGRNGNGALTRGGGTDPGQEPEGRSHRSWNPGVGTRRREGLSGNMDSNR